MRRLVPRSRQRGGSGGRARRAVRAHAGLPLYARRPAAREPRRARRRQRGGDARLVRAPARARPRVAPGRNRQPAGAPGRRGAATHADVRRAAARRRSGEPGSAQGDARRRERPGRLFRHRSHGRPLSRDAARVLERCAPLGGRSARRVPARAPSACGVGALLAALRGRLGAEPRRRGGDPRARAARSARPADAVGARADAHRGALRAELRDPGHRRLRSLRRAALAGRRHAASRYHRADRLRAAGLYQMV